ncbi:MAG: DUF4832 domain-containing protein [Planctomycetaceae bacterium]|jgi:hypothetical protein|nr:DUF4832 domain-containing protein [Planctomycetaceae bacterium]
MKKISLLFLLTLVWGISSSFAEDTKENAQEMVIVQPTDTGEPLVNPGMGWTMHFYSNIPANYGSKLEPSDSLEWFPGCSTVYLRLPWAYIEPEEGKFNWAIVDTPAQRWIAKGKKIAFRFTCCESWLRWAMPEWVQKAGAKGFNYNFGQGVSDDGKLWVPVYDDPVFLEKLEHFLAAAGKRYNGNPDVEFIDVGTFGMWGEGHTFGDNRLSQEETDKMSKIHLDLHKKYFPDTLLCISDDISGPENREDDWQGIKYALSQGVTLRDDSILVQAPPKSWFHAEMADMFWRTLPVILEHEHYGGSVIKKAWSGDLLIKSVEDYHASFMSIHWWPEILLKENQETIEKINRRIGYRLQLRELRYPKQVTIAQPFTVDWSWANAGVAPCYHDGFPALTLKDNKNGVVSVLVEDTFDMKSLPVAPPDAAEVKSVKSEFRVGLVAPTTAPGIYDVYVSVGRSDGTPQIALPLPDNDGQRRYKIGQIELTAEK